MQTFDDENSAHRLSVVIHFITGEVKDGKLLQTAHMSVLVHVSDIA